MALRGANFRFTATNAAAPAMKSVQTGLRSIQRETVRTQAVGRSWNRGLSENRRAVQQLGFQMTDFGVQLAGGQNAMLAFVQQGGQMLQVFGPMGAVLAALLTVFGTLAIVLGKTGKSLADIFPLMGVLQEDFRQLGEIVTWFKELFFDTMNLLVNNLDTLIITMAVAVGWFATKWVVGVVAANGVTRVFIGSLITLQTILLRFLPVAVFIGLGFLVERFLQLAQVLGTTGEAFTLVGRVAKEVFQNIGTIALGLLNKFISLGLGIDAALTRGLAKVVVWLGPNFINPIVGGLVGAYLAVAAGWEQLPTAFKRIGALAINGLIDVVEKGIGALFAPVNSLLEKAGLDVIPPPDLSAWKRTVPGEAGAVGKAAREAFDSAMEIDFAGAMGAGLEAMADDSARLSDAFSKMGDVMFQVAGKAMPEWQKLKDLLSEGPGIDVRDWLGGGAGDGKDGGGSASDKTKTEVDKIKKQFLDMRDTISGALLDTFQGLVKGTKDAGDIISDILGKIFDKISDILLTPMFDKVSGGLSSLLFKGFGIPTPDSFAGGGSTGSGPRAGGMDGRGGRLAMIHPQESVVDHTRGGSAGGGTVVNVYNYSQGGVRQERGMGPDGTEFVDVIVEDSMSTGRYDSAQRSRYGNRPIAVRR